MSHVATIEIEVKDLDALARAAQRLGLEFRHGQTEYKWWGQHEGDYPLPTGFVETDLGKCDHAIHAPDAEYEVGVVRRRDGRPGWTLLWDFIDSRLVKAIGVDGRHLKREYAAVVAMKQAIASGFQVQELRQQDGSIQLRCVR